MTCQARLVLLGSILLCTGLGTVHGFSVFLVPLEAQFDVGRASVSLTYSIALVSITVAVLLGPQVYSKASAATLVLLSGVIAAIGAVLSAISPNVVVLWGAYGVLFGLANGVGYGFTLQLAAQAATNREGLAMGIVTAAYALGAALSPPLFDRAIEADGVATAMLGLAGTLAAIAFVAAFLIRKSAMTFQGPDKKANTVRFASVLPMWLVYLTGVLAGLMTIGHAAGIAADLAPGLPRWGAPVVVAVFNLLGAVLAGRATDYLPPRIVLVALPSCSVVALVALTMGQGGWIVCLSLAAIGFAYGGTIAVWPAVIAKRAGHSQSALFYGLVFTAWGTAGLAGPWLAGALYDANGDYALALSLAATSALAAAIGAGVLFRRG